jgi:hypothetical protein
VAVRAPDRPDARHNAVVFRLVVAAVLFGALAHPIIGAADEQTPVLGWKDAFTPYGKGWGAAHPTTISNGGDPNGHAWNLRWSGWGNSTATAEGFTWIFRPQGGGYFSKPGEIQFRATDLGRCSPAGPLAYRQLRARESTRPGGPYGPWFRWNGRQTICTSS